MKPKQLELTKVEILILSTLGEICNKLEDILKGSRRKFELNITNYILEDIRLLWRAPEIYNHFYLKFGFKNREELKCYIDQYIERLEINDAWESLEDIEAYWNEFVLTVSRKLLLNEDHKDNFIKYYFINTKQLYDINKNINISSGIFEKLSLVIMYPIYIPGTILNNFLFNIEKLKKELYIFGINITVILFGSNKKAKLWLKQYKVNCNSVYVDSSDEILKARRNLNNIFTIQSMENIGLSSKVKKSFIIDDEVNWQKYLFPGGITLVNSDGTVYYEHLCSFIGDFPNNEELIEKIMISFGEINELSKEQSVKYLKDGMKYYIEPKFERFQFEKHSGFYYDPETTLYYEPKSGYFYDGDRGIYLHWSKESACYLSVSNDNPGTSNNNFENLNCAIKEDTQVSIDIKDDVILEKESIDVDNSQPDKNSVKLESGNSDDGHNKPPCKKFKES